MSQTANQPPALTAAFATVDEAQWRALALKALRGAPFESLVSQSHDDIEIQPLYARAKGGQGALARSGDGVTALARIDLPDAVHANAQIRVEIAGGAGGVQLIFAGSVGAHGFGLPLDVSFANLLDGIDPATCALVLDGPRVIHAHAMSEAIATSGLDRASARVSFGLDPMADGADASDAMAEAARALSAQGFAGPFLVADGRSIHAAGGSEAQELAHVAAAALFCMRALERAGIALVDAQRMIELRMAVDADQFLSIAKLRAMRRMWARIEEACGLAPAPVRLLAETAWRMMTRNDAHINLLRGTVAAFSAVAGGADSVAVMPFSQALGLPDDFARRMARNTLTILSEESHTGHVIDPAAGSGAFEALTDALCEKAWTLFQHIEAAGGAGTAASRALLGNAIAEVREKRLRNTATRREAITGVSQFANLAEQPAAVLAPLADGPAASMNPFAPMRIAEPFERARTRAAQSAEPPRIFLACIGSLADFGARAGFARDLFATGGITALEPGGFTHAGDMAQAFQQSGARLACLCSSDALYGEHGEAFAQALKHAGARQVWLAGKGGAREAALRAAGVDGFAFAGGDALAIINLALDEAVK